MTDEGAVDSGGDGVVFPLLPGDDTWDVGPYNGPPGTDDADEIDGDVDD